MTQSAEWKLLKMGRDRREPLDKLLALAGPPYGLDTPQRAPQRTPQPRKTAKCTPPPRAKNQHKLTPLIAPPPLPPQHEMHATRRIAATRGHRMHTAPSYLACRA